LAKLRSFHCISGAVWQTSSRDWRCWTIFPNLRQVIGLIHVSSDIEALLAELTEIFSRVDLANAHNVLTTIVFIYGVASLAALGGMIPYIRETTALSASSYA
jgi:hypothetical protein